MKRLVITLVKRGSQYRVDSLRAIEMAVNVLIMVQVTGEGEIVDEKSA